MRSVETEWRRLGDVERYGDGFARLEVILSIRRLWRSFRRAHGGPAPPPSPGGVWAEPP